MVSDGQQIRNKHSQNIIKKIFLQQMFPTRGPPSFATRPATRVNFAYSLKYTKKN